MCQLAAYIGNKNVIPSILNALKNQEAYYGAHATGIGFLEDRKVIIKKETGHIDVFKEKVDTESLESNISIAHSRIGYWADGKWDEASNIQKMAHPFLDCNEELCLIHNGVISNKNELWKKLKPHHKFTSYDPNLNTITDSEVAVHLLEDELGNGKSIDQSIRAIVKKLKGTFLFAILKRDIKDTIWIVNWHQPCFIALGTNEAFFCSSKHGYNKVIDPRNYSLFEPPKNSIIKLKRGQVSIEILDNERKVPQLELDQCVLAEEILQVLKNEEEINFIDLWKLIFPNKVAKAYNKSAIELERMKQNGISIVNPYIHTLDMLVNEGKIKQFVRRNKEAGVENTPRYNYKL
jgi:glucosamine--fructose-6-phosphate aminotransferase (isomerizing)